MTGRLSPSFPRARRFTRPSNSYSQRATQANGACTWSRLSMRRRFWPRSRRPTTARSCSRSRSTNLRSHSHSGPPQSPAAIDPTQAALLSPPSSKSRFMGTRSTWSSQRNKSRMLTLLRMQNGHSNRTRTCNSSRKDQVFKYLQKLCSHGAIISVAASQRSSYSWLRKPQMSQPLWSIPRPRPLSVLTSLTRIVLSQRPHWTSRVSTLGVSKWRRTCAPRRVSQAALQPTPPSKTKAVKRGAI